MSQPKEPDYRLIESISGRIDEMVIDLREIKRDLKDNKEAMDSDIVHLKLGQERCNSYWGTIGKTFFSGSLLGTLGYFITQIFPPKQ